VTEPAIRVIRESLRNRGCPRKEHFRLYIFGFV
jgi:hypothetical protein